VLQQGRDKLSSPAEEERYGTYVDRIARGAGISTFGQGLGRVLAIMTQIVLARMYGPAQLGFYVLGTTMVGVVERFAEFGMNRAAVRYVAHHDADGDDSRLRGTILLTLGTTFALSLTLSVLMFLGAGLLANEVFSKPLMETMFRVFSISVPFFTLMSIALYATEGFQTVKYSSMVKGLWQPLISFVLIVALYLLGARALGAAAAYVVSMIVGAALALYYLRRLFPRLLDPQTPAVFEVRETFNVSGQVWISQVAEYAHAWVAVTVLGVYATAESVGIYNAAARIAWIPGVIFMAFAGIFSPMIANLYRRGELVNLNYLFKDVSRWIFSAGLVVFMLTLLMCKDILAVFGDEFISGWGAMIVVAGAQLFSSSVGITNRLLVMTEYQRIYMWAMAGALGTVVVLSFVLIPVYGIMGAAWASAGSIVFYNAITLIAVGKVMGFWPYNRQYLKSVIAGLLAAAVVVLVRQLLGIPVGFVAILVLTPLFLVSFAGVLLGLGLSHSDQQFLKAVWIALRRFRVRGTSAGTP
jgi:O-antigen/teichoic acid export membrane protein